MNQNIRRKIISLTVLVLTVVAFAGSYRHGVVWVDQHTPGHGSGSEVWSWVTAALPEVMVIVAVLSFPDRPRDPRVWVTGVSAVSWTLWANGASAGPGVQGLVVAMWPAWAALSALTLMGHPGKVTLDPEPSQVRDVDQDSEAELRAKRVKARTARLDRERKARELAPEPVDRVTVFERDLWTCHVCEGHVDRELSSNDPMGATLDHVVPLSAGGPYSYANVKLAHRKCNESKAGVTNPDPLPAGPVPREEAIKWALNLDPIPSTTVIMDELQMSLSTAKRVRKACLEIRKSELGASRAATEGETS